MELDLVSKYFLPERGWKIKPISSREVDLRATKPGEKLRCMDPGFGIKSDGTYDPNLVPMAPALPGAMDGISAFLPGQPEARVQQSAKMVRETGFIPADHGDYVKGDIEGCRFRSALLEGKFPDLELLSVEEIRVLRSKVGVEHIILYRKDKHPEGFLLNPIPSTTALPQDYTYYPIDIWYPEKLGIKPEKFLPVVEKCGELLLPENSRILYVITR